MHIIVSSNLMDLMSHSAMAVYTTSLLGWHSQWYSTHLTSRSFHIVHTFKCALMSVYQFTPWCCTCELSVTNTRICYVMLCLNDILTPTCSVLIWSHQQLCILGLKDAVTRSPAVAQGLHKHAVSWNLVKRCTNVRWIALEMACNWRMTFKVIKVINTDAIR